MLRYPNLTSLSLLLTRHFPFFLPRRLRRRRGPPFSFLSTKLFRKVSHNQNPPFSFLYYIPTAPSNCKKKKLISISSKIFPPLSHLNPLSHILPVSFLFPAIFKFCFVGDKVYEGGGDPPNPKSSRIISRASSLLILPSSTFLNDLSYSCLLSIACLQVVDLAPFPT